MLLSINIERGTCPMESCDEDAFDGEEISPADFKVFWLLLLLFLNGEDDFLLFLLSIPFTNSLMLELSPKSNAIHNGHNVEI